MPRGKPDARVPRLRDGRSALTAAVVLEAILPHEQRHQRDVAVVHGLQRDSGAASTSGKRLSAPALTYPCYSTTAKNKSEELHSDGARRTHKTGAPAAVEVGLRYEVLHPIEDLLQERSLEEACFKHRGVTRKRSVRGGLQGG